MDTTAVEQEVMHYDVVIVGAGPAGLAAAIRIKQMAEKQGKTISVCVLEKGADVGNHIVSGAVFDPSALDELIPDWAARQAPLRTAVKEDHVAWLTQQQAWRIPTWLIPPMMHNQGNFIISLGELCRWLQSQAEALGVEIYAGFSAQQLCYEGDKVAGVITGDMGLNAKGEATANFSAGIEIRALYTLIAEGARGSLTQQLATQYALWAEASPAKYGIGFKETWRVPKAQHAAGRVQHFLGWPLTSDTGGGGFIYHHGEDLLSVGYVVHLDYQNPYLSPYDEFQRFKTHPSVHPLLAQGERLSYGARAIAEGGVQALPKLIFPGGALIGCSAGMVNLPKIKGSHNAIRSGILAADAVCWALAQEVPPLLTAYAEQFKTSAVWRELDAARNVKPYLACFGSVWGSLLGGIEMWLQHWHIRLPWTLPHRAPDHACLKPAASQSQIAYPTADGIVSFDKLSSVALANIGHTHNQPNHLLLTDPAIAISVNWQIYASPEQRYCPAGVYEIVDQATQPRLQINAQNCIHCKTCDIKDPQQNITWVPPEGGSGPNYVNQ